MSRTSRDGQPKSCVAFPRQEKTTGVIQYRATEEERLVMARVAKVQGRTVSDVLRDAVGAYLAALVKVFPLSHEENAVTQEAIAIASHRILARRDEQEERKCILQDVGIIAEAQS